MFVRGLKSYGITSFLIPKISDHLLLKVFNYNNDHCYFRQYSTKIIQCDVKNSTEQSTDKVSSYPKYLSWTNSNELAHYLSQRVVAITEHFVVIDKPPNLSVWGHSLAKREVYSTIDPKLACTSSISINDCLQQLSNILASQEEKQLKQVSSNDSKNSVNAVEIPKLYIIEALPASYSGLILLGRNEKYTIAARQFYKSAMLGDVPWTLYQKFLIVCWGKPHEIQSKVISFPIAAYQLPGGIHVGYRPSPGEISVGLKRKGTILQKRLQHTTISEGTNNSSLLELQTNSTFRGLPEVYLLYAGCAVVGETFQASRLINTGISPIVLPPSKIHLGYSIPSKQLEILGHLDGKSEDIPVHIHRSHLYLPISFYVKSDLYVKSFVRNPSHLFKIKQTDFSSQLVLYQYHM
ncbi:unnamed protein product [Heterobilharzia americana]|nr:unnamed protein product [Heterobilharzia americana]